MHDGSQRVKRYIVPEKRVDFVFLFDGPIKVSYEIIKRGI